MAGHSHWAGIKHKKAAIDAKRGKLWSKLSKAIIVAAQIGGGDADANSRLRLAVADAKAANMPNDTIDRAIRKGTGELEGGHVEEVVYEGYGPYGVAIMCDIMTDNRNRTAPELRKLFETHQGKLAESGSVAWIFQRKGLFLISKSDASEERLMELALQAGADDLRAESEDFELTCEPEAFSALSDALQAAGVTCRSKQVTRLPSTTVDLQVDAARQVLKLLEALDDHDDVQNVSANLNIPSEVMAE